MTSTHHSHAGDHDRSHELRATFGWRLLVSGVMLALMGLAPLWQAGQDLAIRWNPTAVRVVATVDSVERYCDRSCDWRSIGHYTVAGQTERGVTVADGRSTPARGPQTMIVVARVPRSVVNAAESPAGLIAVGGFAVLLGVAFLWFWSRPVIANRRARTVPAAPQESSAAQWQRLGQERVAARRPQDAPTTRDGSGPDVPLAEIPRRPSPNH